MEMALPEPQEIVVTVRPAGPCIAVDVRSTYPVQGVATDVGHGKALPTPHKFVAIGSVGWPPHCGRRAVHVPGVGGGCGRARLR